jgi:hypothetical protein
MSKITKIHRHAGATFTGGIWRIRKPAIRVARDTDFITEIYTGDNKDVASECIGIFKQASCRNVKEAEANAYLVASAADLLASLENAESYLAARNLGEGAKVLLVNIRTALAKARGE